MENDFVLYKVRFIDIIVVLRKFTDTLVSEMVKGLFGVRNIDKIDWLIFLMNICINMIYVLKFVMLLLILFVFIYFAFLILSSIRIKGRFKSAFKSFIFFGMVILLILMILFVLSVEMFIKNCFGMELFLYFMGIVCRIICTNSFRFIFGLTFSFCVVMGMCILIFVFGFIFKKYMLFIIWLYVCICICFVNVCICFVFSFFSFVVVVVCIFRLNILYVIFVSVCLCIVVFIFCLYIVIIVFCLFFGVNMMFGMCFLCFVCVDDVVLLLIFSVYCRMMLCVLLFVGVVVSVCVSVLCVSDVMCVVFSWWWIVYIFLCCVVLWCEIDWLCFLFVVCCCIRCLFVGGLSVWWVNVCEWWWWWWNWEMFLRWCWVNYKVCWSWCECLCVWCVWFDGDGEEMMD